MQVEPVERKRAEAALNNFNNFSAAEFEIDGSLTKDDGESYLFEIKGYMERGDKSKGGGTFNLNTENGSEQEMKGDFVFERPYLYFTVDESTSSDGALLNNLPSEIFEEENQQWVKMEIPEEYFKKRISLKNEEIEVISEEEELNEKEMFHYKIMANLNDFFKEDFEAEIFTGTEDLNIYKLFIESRLELTEDLNFDPLFELLSESKFELDLKAEFFNFDEVQSISTPENFLEL